MSIASEPGYGFSDWEELIRNTAANTTDDPADRRKVISDERCQDLGGNRGPELLKNVKQTYDS